MEGEISFIELVLDDQRLEKLIGVNIRGKNA